MTSSAKKTVFILVFSVVIAFVVSIIGIFSTTYFELMQITIVIATTILGFFGIFTVYLLSSYNQRLDSFTEKLLNYNNLDINITIEHLYSSRDLLEEKRQALLCNVRSTFTLLISSLAFSIIFIGLFGVTSTIFIELCKWLACFLSIFSLFTGLNFIRRLFVYESSIKYRDIPE